MNMLKMLSVFLPVYKYMADLMIIKLPGPRGNSECPLWTGKGCFRRIKRKFTGQLWCKK